MVKLATFQWTINSVLLGIAVCAILVNFYRLKIEHDADKTRFNEIVEIPFPTDSHIREFKRLIYKYTSFSKHKGALHFSARHCDIDLNRQMVSQGADVNQKLGWIGETPLSIALLYGNREVVVYFLESGANPNIAKGPIQNGDFSLVAVLCRHNRLSDVKLLHSYGASLTDTQNKNNYNDQPLCFAVSAGHLEMIDFLLKNGAVTAESINGLKEQRNHAAKCVLDTSLPMNIRTAQSQISNLLSESIDQFDSSNRGNK